MDKIPPEIAQSVVYHLGTRDLCSLRLSNHIFASWANPQLFSVLCILDKTGGNAVQVARLDKIVDICLPVSRLVRKLHFAPTFYIPGFWEHYRIIRNLEDETPVVHSSYQHTSDCFDSDEEYGHKCTRRTYEWRAKRSIREMPLIARAETKWEEAVEFQDANRFKTEMTIAKLLSSLTALNEVEVSFWTPIEYEGLALGGSTLYDYKPELSYSRNLLEILAKGLRSLDRHIKSLTWHEIYPNHVKSSADMVHIFQLLKRLQLDFIDVSIFLDSNDGDFSTLLKGSVDTLQQLLLNCSKDWIPAPGIHFLEHIFGSQSFPCLSSFTLSVVITHSFSLGNFLAAQSNLRELVLKYVYLGDRNSSWHSIAEILPKSLKIWTVFDLGDDPYMNTMEFITYKYITKWNVYEDPPRGWNRTNSTKRGEFGFNFHRAVLARARS